MNESKNNRVGGITRMYTGVKIANLTPHAITVLKNGEEIAVYEASGSIARCESKTFAVREIAGIPLTETRFGKLYLIDRDRVKHELPEQQDGTFYIVSALVARAAGREDFVIVDDTVRDNNGRIIGCQSFAHV